MCFLSPDVIVDVNDRHRSRTFFRKVTTCTGYLNVPSHRHWVLPVDAGLMGISYLMLLILFSRQTEHSRTPSGISRVSLWSFLIQATMDSVSFAGHITFAILAEGRPSLSLIVPAFLACLVFVYEAVRKIFYLLLLVIDPNDYIAILGSYSSNSRTWKFYATFRTSHPASYSNRQRNLTTTSTS